MIYCIADMHLGHKNCLKYDNRPFATIEEQDTVLIKNWNRQVINGNDDVYIVGDISFYGPAKTLEILRQLKGHKHLIIGNHDHKLLKSPEVRHEFVEITGYKELYLDGNTRIVLCHYPIPTFNGHCHGWYHLYGHVHTSPEWDVVNAAKSAIEKLSQKPCQMYNVGAMVPYMNYTPKTLDQIINGSFLLQSTKLK